MTLAELNKKIFHAVNSLQGKNRWLDTFGRAGAEFAIVAMCGWFAVMVFYVYGPSRVAIAWPILFLGTAWAAAWMLSMAVGAIVREPRPAVDVDGTKRLFTPMQEWKSFPSDHAMSAFLIFFMALVFALPGAWGLLALALWVSWGRVFSGVHYPGDIVGGIGVAAFAAGAGYLFLNYLG